jgi:hypothetical protein
MPHGGGPQLFDPEYDLDGNLVRKRCRKCLDKLPIGDFYRARLPGGRLGNGKSICKICWSEVHSPAYDQQKRDRKDPLHRPRFILKDANGMDRKRGLSNDLTLGWVTELVSRGCSYCGDPALRMTLDRLDNDKAHTKDNVVPACIRCNFVRGTMPHAAWLVLAPGMREAREAGLFGGWTGAFVRSGRKRKTRRGVVTES